MFLFEVSKSGFEKCIVDEETSEPVAKCADPYRLVNIPVVFRQYTPVPNGLEYEPGNSYYFICKFVQFSSLFLTITSIKFERADYF